MNINTFSESNRKLEEIEQPQLRVDSVYNTFTADLQRINHFFWSTEISYAHLWSQNNAYEESNNLASEILKDSNANAFKERLNKIKPHYTATIGSLLDQTRWNYDALGRYALIEIMLSLEVYIKGRLKPILGEKEAVKHISRIRQQLNLRRVELDPEVVFRLYVFKEIRNTLVHDRSTLHSFPSDILKKKLDAVMINTDSWSDNRDWKALRERARNEIIWTSKHRAEKYDLPHMFFIAIFGMSTASEFAIHMEYQIKKTRRRIITYKMKEIV